MDATVRPEILAVLKAVPDLGVVHNYDRNTVDWAKFIELFRDRKSGTILGCEISRSGFQAEKVSVIEEDRASAYIIRFYMAVNDDKQSELAFNAKIDAIATAFRGNHTLNSTCTDAGPVSAQVIDTRSFGSVLCHYAELRLPVNELLT